MLDGTNCCAVALDTFSNTNVYQNTWTEHRATDDSESLQNRGASGRKFLHITLLAHCIYRWPIEL
jgi:hypothetical protein